ncbi:4Fe-4S ferredoxin [Lachnospiraceae bacterium OttesenSCG-928-D06]|nr:4Fe-4S ferredoxin [Lachnospiraceae bacterium OttesenSCG-928-D06]
MKRRIIKIDGEKCNGCSLCVNACHEGAIGMVDGKATLLRDDYCDGLGDCLPVCPTNAITFEEREAAAYDEVAVKANMAKKSPIPCACPGSNAKTIVQPSDVKASIPMEHLSSKLTQWPVQIKLVPENAAYFQNANLLIAADCTAFSYGNFHEQFIKNHITLIGCPKLDEGDYTEKLTAIIKNNHIKSIKVVRMEVPCCSGIANAAITALKNSGKMIPWQIVTISTDGNILDE